MSNFAQEQMYSEHRTGQMSIHVAFKMRLKSAAEQGLLLFVKYGLILALIYASIIFGTNVIAGSTNGTQAALYLQELQNKGYLPKVVNGQIPNKEIEQNAK